MKQRVLKALACSVALTVLGTAAVLGQTAPFMIDPTAPATTPTAPAATTVPATTPATSVPNLRGTQPDIVATATPSTPGSAPAVADPTFRPIVPFETLRLEGEAASAAWTVFLTSEQAASATALDLGYINAVVVAPEASDLTVLVNDRAVLTTPIASSSDVGTLSAPLPAGLLRAGPNLIRVMASQRHRTDCTIPSTYELWTELDSARTGFSFTAPVAGAIARIDDLAAVGVDATGRTTIEVLTPSLDAAGLPEPLFALVQALAIRMDAPSAVVEVRTGTPGPQESGHLAVILAPASDLVAVLGRSLPEAASRPVVSFVTDTAGRQVLVVSGPTWDGVEAAVATITATVNRPLGVASSAISSLSWHSPEIPLLAGATSMPLSSLGIQTEEFNGRRYTSEFAVAIPGDFYAESYGHATLLLDAAYTEAVQPGSHIDVYVNGQIAVTVPVMTSGGGIFRKLPVEVPLRHFHPGANIITIEAVMLTALDAACPPAATGSTASRFVLFGTSEFHMPDYARIGQVPNLAAFAGTGYPYGEATSPVSLLLGRTDAATLSAAATLLGRVAQNAGRPVPLELAANAGVIGGRNALLVGVASQLPATAIGQVGLSDSTRTVWEDRFFGTGALLLPTTATASSDEIFQRWSDALSGGGGWRGQLTSFEDWLRRTFDISFDNLRFTPAAQLDFLPSNEASLVLAQGRAPGGGTWTVLSAPSAAALEQATARLVSSPAWRDVSGRVSAYRAGAESIETVAVGAAALVTTQPASFSNLRLIATNWMSQNIVIYAALLVALCILLGIATTFLLNVKGRHDDQSH